MVLIEEDAMVVHAFGITMTSKMLAVLANTTVACTNMASLLAVLLQAHYHGCLSTDVACKLCTTMQQKGIL